MLALTCRDTQKKNEKLEVELHYRTEKDIICLLNYILGGSSEKPITCGASGFISQNLNAEYLANEIISVQNFYKKTDGIRVRHQMITMDLEDLSTGLEIEQAKRIAEMMSKIYIYKGFQNVWSVTLLGNMIKISIAINTVSCYDGSKYHYNKHNVYIEEYRFLIAVYNKIVKADDSYIDYRSLYFYPYSI